MTYEVRTAAAFKQALEQTFAFRGTHDVPDHLPEPPESWEAPYAAIAKEDQLRWTTLAEAFEASRSFLDPVLTGPRDEVWDPTIWTWRAPTPAPDPEKD